MLYALALIVGSLLWAAGLLIGFSAGTIESTSMSLVAAGLFLVAIGVWAQKTDPMLNRAGRVGVVMVSFGSAAFATVALLLLNAGVVSEAEIALTPFYLMAVLFLVSGLVAFSVYFLRAAGQPALGVAFAALAVMHVSRPFFAGSDELHLLANLGLVTVLLVLAVSALKRTRR